METKSFYQFYFEHGFNFNPEVLTRYCLSLYTKPFVILSGISGTGKTKIAQLFNNPVKESLTVKEDTTTQDSIQTNEWITLTVTKGMLEDGRGNLPVSSLDAIYETAEIDEINLRIKKLIEEHRADNITEPSGIEIIDTTNNITVQATVYLQRASSPLVRVRFKSRRGEESYDSRHYFEEYHRIGDVLGLRKIDKRKFEIVTKNDKELIQISKQVRLHEQQHIENILFTSVKSDWTDASAIVGFFNLVTQKYYVPPVLRFLLQAKENPELPFFLVLDEMNLSKVEHYFSDILSCMESRYLLDGKEIVQEKIMLYGSGDILDTDDYEFDIIPSKIEIPLNFYITGTVNIDESTYMFSPKVLDRANVIEFNEVDLPNYDSDTLSNLSDYNYILQKFPTFGNVTLASKEHYKKLSKETKDFLKGLIDILRPYNLHFGYRVINEFSLFVLNSLEYIENTEKISRKSTDIQIVQKVLPKFNGSFNKLDEPLRKLMAFLLPSDITATNIDIEFLNKIDYSKVDYPLSIRKLSLMYTNLINNGFTSFIE